MAIYRSLISFPLDTGLPRDRMVMTPHFEGNDPAALGAALKANLIANPNIANAFPFTVKIYDAEKAPPSYPLYESTIGTGNPATGNPRELALCLSYYATFNRKRFRGRIYIPLALCGGGAAGLRPTGTQIGKALSFGPTFGKNLPSGHWWTVWSRVDKASRQVNNYWVDDEWDIIRSRGMRGTTRQTGTIP